jgi:hypothetical protein
MAYCVFFQETCLAHVVLSKRREIQTRGGALLKTHTNRLYPYIAATVTRTRHDTTHRPKSRANPTAPSVKKSDPRTPLLYALAIDTMCRLLRTSQTLSAALSEFSSWSVATTQWRSPSLWTKPLWHRGRIWARDLLFPCLDRRARSKHHCECRGAMPSRRSNSCHGEQATRKESALVRCFGLPMFWGAQHLRLASEHRGICGGGRIHTKQCPAPDEEIVDLMQNDNGLKPFTELHIMH